MATSDRVDHVFVYGLLMEGFELHRFVERGTLVGKGSMRGTLVSLGRYPGLIDGTGSVRGEVYVFDDLPAALDVLDDVESFDPTDPANSEYVREARPMKLDDHRELTAWVYVYNRPVPSAPRVPGGDWRNGRP
ncbi:MAG TPA: gamma-glutamylcyclotransferase family protein [Candidatus Eremiobacteraceae bacterium]|nr:gamma-glutamylcyclotransferase family protein [Candidatus Eremiobacteraceae bacterium]